MRADVVRTIVSESDRNIKRENAQCYHTNRILTDSDDPFQRHIDYIYDNDEHQEV